MREQPRPGKSALNGSRRSGRFHHTVATAACKLRPDMAEDLETLWNVLQLFTYILAELT
jgi:hypothetical protein